MRGILGGSGRDQEKAPYRDANEVSTTSFALSAVKHVFNRILEGSRKIQERSRALIFAFRRHALAVGLVDFVRATFADFSAQKLSSILSRMCVAKC